MEGSCSLSILVVDEFQDAADTLTELLRLHGHNVGAAYSRRQALQVAAENRPDCALIDVRDADLLADELKMLGVNLVVALSTRSRTDLHIPWVMKTAPSTEVLAKLAGVRKSSAGNRCQRFMCFEQAGSIVSN